MVTGGADSVRVQGWTSDWNTLNPIDIVVMINGVWAPGVFTANLPRTDVAARYGRGANFGYDVTLPAPAGALSVCVVALNVGRGENTILGCATTTATTPTTPTTTTTTSTTTTSLVPVGLRPTISSVDPAYGATTGGSQAILTGSGFTGTTSVKFDGVEALIDSDSSGPFELVVNAPARASAGPAQITVTTPGGTSDPVDFTYIDCSSANWVPAADLRGCDLSEQDLSGLSFRRADLTGANFERAFLESTDFEFADLTDASLTSAIIRNTIFNDAILVGASLLSTVVESAEMRSANLTRADLTQSDLTNVTFDFNTIWSDTTCPNGNVQSTECPRA